VLLKIKKYEAKKAKKEQEAASQPQSSNVTANGQPTSTAPKINSPTSTANNDLTDDPEKIKNKKIKSVSNNLISSERVLMLIL